MPNNYERWRDDLLEDPDFAAEVNAEIERLRREDEGDDGWDSGVPATPSPKPEGPATVLERPEASDEA